MIGWFGLSGGCPVRIGPQRSFKPTDVACRWRAETLINGSQSVRFQNPLSSLLSQDVHESLRTGGDQSSPRQNRAGQTCSMAGDHPVRDLLRAGPHCNGAGRGALRLAKLGRPVKNLSAA